MGRYDSNRIYVSDEEQDKVRETRILLGGAGIGSIIAECALRFGFEDIVIVDGSKVELSDLNRQDYEQRNVGKSKAESLAKRLLKINSKANVQFYDMVIDKSNLNEILSGVKIAINALDYNSEIPFIFDEVCSGKKIPVLHPYNFGWGAFLTIIKPGGYQLSEIAPTYKGFELKLAEFIARYCTFWNMPNRWLGNVIEKYNNESGLLPFPKLSVASWIVAGLCVNAMFDILFGKEVKFFPKFYFTSLRCDPA